VRIVTYGRTVIALLATAGALGTAAGCGDDGSSTPAGGGRDDSGLSGQGEVQTQERPIGSDDTYGPAPAQAPAPAADQAPPDSNQYAPPEVNHDQPDALPTQPSPVPPPAEQPPADPYP
jgi:hypothetical protein